MAINLREYRTTQERKNALERELNVSCPKISEFSFDEQEVSRKNCENLIGGISIPVGIAGPLQVKSTPLHRDYGGQAKLNVQNYYIPLATTEGALVASVNRGCKAVVESGGAHVISKKIGITRAPVFTV